MSVRQVGSARSEFIVAEVSKNWHREREPAGPVLCQWFEEVIAVNRQRGYVLHQFALSQVMVSPDEMTETIIAVFRREQQEEP